MSRESVHLVRFRRDDGRLTTKYHAVEETRWWGGFPGGRPDFEFSTACGLASTTGRAAEVAVAYAGSLGMPGRGEVCGICWHEADLHEFAADWLLRRTSFLRTGSSPSGSLGVIKGIL